MSDATGAVVGLIALKASGVFDKWIKPSQTSNGNDTYEPPKQKDKVELSYYELGDRCSSASDGKLLRPGHRCIHGITQLSTSEY